MFKKVFRYAFPCLCVGVMWGVIVFGFLASPGW